MKHTECEDCELSNGDCGYHFKMDGVTNYDIASLSACDQYENCMFFKSKAKTSGDLISREALKEVFSNYYSGYGDLATFSISRVKEIIDNAPTVETSKIEHKAYNEGFKDGVEQGIKLSQGQKGEWIDHSEDYGYVECPICEHLTNCDGNKDELHYCWYCGAKMGKVEQNEI
jgi:hypothetical protein